MRKQMNMHGVVGMAIALAGTSALLKQRGVDWIQRFRQDPRKLVEWLLHIGFPRHYLTNRVVLEIFGDLLEQTRLGTAKVGGRYDGFKGSPEEVERQALAELARMTGLPRVKQGVTELRALARWNRDRAVPIRGTHHLCLVGNPGTGKTTIGKVIAGIYYAYGIVPSPDVRFTSRQELVQQYIGHTEKRTKQVIEESIGKTLFVDEAYLLNGGSANDFGHQAIGVLIEAMENLRDRMCVIVAGYPDQMRELVDSNPGMASRLGATIEFDDYDGDDLTSIFSTCVTGAHLRLADDARLVLRAHFDQQYRRRARGFGNGRLARTTFEKAVVALAVRVGRAGGDTDTITVADVHEALTPGSDVKSIH